MAEALLPKPSPAQVAAMFDRLSRLYSQRNTEYTTLRRAFDGDFPTQTMALATGVGATNDRRQVTYNMVNSNTRRFMDEMSANIRIQGVPRGVDERDLELAEKRQKALERVKDEEKLQLKIVMAAFHQSLLDKAIWHVRPNPKKVMKVDIDLITPEYYFPLPISSNWLNKKAVLYSWIRHDLEDLDVTADPMGSSYQQAWNDQNRVIEYWDDNYCLRYERGIFTFEATHKLGIISFFEAHNIPVPDRHRGQGDNDQSIGLNTYLNQLYSDQADVLGYMANPIIVVRGSAQANSSLTFGPRAIWQLERDASAEILTWAGAPPSFEAQLLRTQQAIEDNSGISSSAYGRDIPAGVSGETIRSVLAGFNTRVGTKQQLMGLTITEVMRAVQRIWETQFPNVELVIPGEGRGEQGAILKPTDMKGFYDVRCVFEPQNETIRVFTEIQKMKEKVQSRLTTMRNLGIINPAEEYRRIVIEQTFDASLANLAVGGQGSMMLPQQLDKFMPRPPRTPPGPGIPQDQLDIGALGEAQGQADPGRLAEMLTGMTGQPGSPGSGPVKVADIMMLLEDADLEGVVKAEGPLAEDGQTEGEINLRITDPVDEGKVRQALGPLAGRVRLVMDDTAPAAAQSLVVGRPSRRGR